MQKIPPRALFAGQIYASIIATMTQTGGALGYSGYT